MDLRGSRLDVHVRRGADIDIPLVLGVDLTGATVRARVQNALGALIVVFTIAVTDALAGKVTLSLLRTALVGTDDPPGALTESTTYEWVCSYEKGGKLTPAYYGVFAISGASAT